MDAVENVYQRQNLDMQEIEETDNCGRTTEPELFNFIQTREKIMKHQFYRNRSEFWITVYENEDSYSISTNEKYINIINYAFPNLVASSPTKWRKSEKYDNMSNLWLPEGCYTQEVMKIFLEWCKDVTQNILWIHLNKNIENYFNNELDYCIASDFNIIYGVSRTEIGEAEYQLKYNIDNLSKKEQTQYAYSYPTFYA